MNISTSKSPKIGDTTFYPQQVRMKTSSEESVQKFTSYYWNLSENKPSEILSKLFNLLLPNLPCLPTLDQAVKESQAQWIQKTRWDVKQDNQFIQDIKGKIQPLLQDLGLTSSFCPEGHFDTALLLAGRANIFLARCYSLFSSIKDNKISVSQIDILAGKQSLHPLELEILKNSSFEICDVTTEEEMARAVSEKMLKPLGISCNIIATDLKDRKPCTEQIVNTWLEIADRGGNQVLIVSDPQFALYQHFQCMESLYKKNIKDVKFDLLSIQLEAHVFGELKISMEETQGNPILLHLDTIARTLYTIQGQINRGFIK